MMRFESKIQPIVYQRAALLATVVSLAFGVSPKGQEILSNAFLEDNNEAAAQVVGATALATDVSVVPVTESTQPAATHTNEVASAGTEISIETDVRGVSGLTAEQLDDYFENTKFKGFGSMFIAAEQKWGIRADFIAAEAGVETGWGTSDIAVRKKNLVGYNAVDPDPNLANTFASEADSIDMFCQLLSRDYLTPTGMYYAGTSIQDVFDHYSTADGHEDVVTEIMIEMHANAA